MYEHWTVTADHLSTDPIFDNSLCWHYTMVSKRCYCSCTCKTLILTSYIGTKRLAYLHMIYGYKSLNSLVGLLLVVQVREEGDRGLPISHFPSSHLRAPHTPTFLLLSYHLPPFLPHPSLPILPPPSPLYTVSRPHVHRNTAPTSPNISRIMSSVATFDIDFAHFNV
jgi:hypothetical protein